MKSLTLLLVIAVATLGFAACASDTVSHTETNKTNWNGTQTHQETTVTGHPNGGVTVDKETERVR